MTDQKSAIELGGCERLYGEDAGRYYVFAEGGRAPSVVHDSRYKAAKEARRLARKHPGTRFHMAKLKESVVFHQDVALNDRVRITSRDHSSYRMYGRVASIDPNGAYAIVFPMMGDETRSAICYRDDFKVLPDPKKTPTIDARVWFKDRTGAPVLATVVSIDDDGNGVVARMDVAPSGPMVHIPIADYQPVTPEAFPVGRFVRIRATHYRFPLQVGYVTAIDEDTVWVRFQLDGESFRFHPGSLMFKGTDNAFDVGRYVRIANILNVIPDSRVGVVKGREGDHVLVSFNGSPATRYSTAYLRPSNAIAYLGQQAFSKPIHSANNKAPPPGTSFWLGADSAREMVP